MEIMIIFLITTNGLTKNGKNGSQKNGNEDINKAADKSKLTASQAILLLAKQVVSVSEREAEEIVECVNCLAEITIQQILNSSDRTEEIHLD